MGRPLELFAGGGGAHAGLVQAGLAGGLAVERNLSACATLAMNGTDVEQLDLTTTDRLLQRVTWQPVLLWASPPCPLHSRATRPQDRVPTQRTPLGFALPKAWDGWPSTLAAVQALQPASVVVENVPGAKVAAHLWASELGELYPHVAVWTLNAAAFGVPQRRVRMFVVASKRPLERPRPTHGQPGSLAPGMQPWVTLGQALPYLRDLAATPPTERIDHPQAGLVYPRQGYGRAGTEPHRLELPSPTVTCAEVKGTRASATTRWSFNGGPDRLSDALFLAVGQRRATIGQAATIQGFDPGWRFAGNADQQYRQIGNAVPPALAAAVVRAVVSWATK